MEKQNSKKSKQHKEILNDLIKSLVPINFEELAFPKVVELKSQRMELQKKIALINNKKDSKVINYENSIQAINTEIKKFKIATKHLLVISIDELIKFAETQSWGLCKNNNFIYLYNGEFWKVLDKEEFQNFLGVVAEKLGIDKFSAKYFTFKDQLYKQFISAGYLPSPEVLVGNVSINLRNGTFDVSDNQIGLRGFRLTDFMTYQLPFDYEPKAVAPMFQSYLNKVLPDDNLQKIIAEYLGYVFISSSTLKLEKALILYGSGANGKSVLFEIVQALFGPENISNFSLQSLTNENGYFRAMLANKLINYASEINGNLGASIFKQLTSGEPVEARLPYGDPFTLTNYGKLIFNCNELPKDVEHTEAFFRRFLIIPFNVIIAEADQDKELAKKIIANELSGIFNWVLEGLKRLLNKKRFTQSDIVDKQLKEYKIQTDNVQQFLRDEGYTPSNNEQVSLKWLFNQYKSYCNEYNYRLCSNKTFSERLKNLGFEASRSNQGITFYICKKYV